MSSTALLAFATAAATLASYLLGSIPTGVLVAQGRGVDLRAVGSGNIGATNAARALGRVAGLLVFAGDALKGFLPTLVCRVALGLPPASVALVGFGAFLGHLYPVYLGFRGGKGVATAAGIFFAMAPLATAVALGVWLLVFLPWRIVSIASLAATLVFPVALVWLGGALATTICAGAVLVLILWRHRGNLARLWRRVESRV